MRLVKAAKASPHAKFYNLSTVHNHYSLKSYCFGFVSTFLPKKECPSGLFEISVIYQILLSSFGAFFRIHNVL